MPYVDRRQWLQLALFSSVFAASPHAAGSNEDERLLARLTQARKSLRSLTADFTQRRHLDLFASDVTSHGKLALLAPDRLRWELLPPDAVTYWVTPSGLSYQSPKSQGHVDRETAGALAASLDDLTALIGGDMRALGRRYTLSGETLGDKTARWTAVPKDKALRKLVRRLEIMLESDLLRPRSVKLWESKDDFTELRFENVKKNVPISPQLMKPPV